MGLVLGIGNALEQRPVGRAERVFWSAAQPLKILGASLDDARQTDAGRLNFGGTLAQLREGLGEEDSAAMAQPDQERRSLCPLIRQMRRTSIAAAVVEIRGSASHVDHEFKLRGLWRTTREVTRIDYRPDRFNAGWIPTPKTHRLPPPRPPLPLPHLPTGPGPGPPPGHACGSTSGHSSSFW